jgi:hypothetical protein
VAAVFGAFDPHHRPKAELPKAGVRASELRRASLVYFGGLFQTIEKATLFLNFSYPDVLA